VRAGGKHNDLENVGYTARHHTFFEMLGNFSFGDYFKRDAIRFAWELLTKDVQAAAREAVATVYIDDDEAYDIWTKEIGVPADRVVRIGDNKGAKYASDNFWQMADTGPCGPCSEIFYDHGPEVFGGPPGSPDAEGDRYIEIWNLVFMQFDRQKNAAGEFTMTPLPKPCVDTGMGLERLAAVLQHVHSNYEIDLFQALIKAAARGDEHQRPRQSVAQGDRGSHPRVLVPDRRRRDSVERRTRLRLRRIIRRAIRHGYQLGQKQPFFYKLVEDLDKQMVTAYPELTREKKRVAEVLKAEEERFGETLENGMKILAARSTRLRSRAARCSTARRRSRSTTRSDSRSISPPTSRGQETCPSTSRLRCGDERAARTRARRVVVQDGRDGRVLRARRPRSAATRRCPRKAAWSRSTRTGAKVDALASGEQGHRRLDRTPSTPSRADRSATAASSPRAARASRCSR
jgi:alanyl-tRNA synthetase